MLCNEVKDKLCEYIYGEIDEEKSLEIENHLRSCESCREEHLELKILLIDDMEVFTAIKNEIEMPIELPNRIKKRLKNNIIIKIPRYIAAACILVLMFYTLPVAAYYLVQNSPLDKYMELNNKIEKEYKEGRGQLIEKSDTMKGITYTVDAIIRKADSTTILFTVKIPKSDNINYAMPSMDRSVITIEDQFGIKYVVMSSGMTLRSANEDGEVKAIVEVEPLKFWCYKLNIRITSMELGKITVKKGASDSLDNALELQPEYVVVKNKNVFGTWQVNFYIDRSYKK